MNIGIYRRPHLAVLISAVIFGSAVSARANSTTFSFSGGGITSSGSFTFVATSVPGIDQITSITGTFADTNVGISGNITGLESVALPPLNQTFVPSISSQGFSVDNLFYPVGNSPIVCAGYPFGGGMVDTYGMVFDIQGGYSADLWSNGFAPGTTTPMYNAADANANGFLDYPNPIEGGGVPVQFNAVPEPATFLPLGIGVLGLAAFRKRKSKV